ncbi:unnamed protein product, partial [Mesorhabditis spiculigera]
MIYSLVSATLLLLLLPYSVATVTRAERLTVAQTPVWGPESEASDRKADFRRAVLLHTAGGDWAMGEKAWESYRHYEFAAKIQRHIFPSYRFYRGVVFEMDQFITLTYGHKIVEAIVEIKIGARGVMGSPYAPHRGILTVEDGEQNTLCTVPYDLDGEGNAYFTCRLPKPERLVLDEKMFPIVALVPIDSTNKILGIQEAMLHIRTRPIGIPCHQYENQENERPHCVPASWKDTKVSYPVLDEERSNILPHAVIDKCECRIY